MLESILSKRDISIRITEIHDRKKRIPPSPNNTEAIEVKRKRRYGCDSAVKNTLQQQDSDGWFMFPSYTGNLVYRSEKCSSQTTDPLASLADRIARWFRYFSVCQPPMTQRLPTMLMQASYKFEQWTFCNYMAWLGAYI